MILTEKISADLPVLYIAIIDYDFVEEGKHKNRTAFIEQALKEKFEREGIDLKPREIKVLEKDWDKSDL